MDMTQIFLQMNSLKNSVQLIGHLGKEIELLELEKGKKLAKLTMATNEYYTDDKGEKQQITDWHNLVAWGNLAELMERSLVKGNEVLVKGKLSQRAYEDKNGDKKYVTEVVVREFLRLTKKQEMPF